MKRTCWVGLLAAGLVMAGASAPPAQAQSVMFKGYTNGCFQGFVDDCSPEDTWVSREDTLRNLLTQTALRYENTAFEETTTAWNTPTAISLGQVFFHWALITLVPDSIVPVASGLGRDFNLRVSFLNPVASDQPFYADLVGSYYLFGDGAITFDFDNSARAFGDRGQYSVRVDDLTLGRSKLDKKGVVAGNLTGYVTAAPTAATVTPEPVSMTLLGTGLVAVGALRRRRRKTSDEA